MTQHFHSVLISFQIIYSGCRFHFNYLHKCFITGNQILFLDVWESKNLDTFFSSSIYLGKYFDNTPKGLYQIPAAIDGAFEKL